MKFKINAELGYSISEPGTVILNIHALDRPQAILKESFSSEPGFQVDSLITPEGNRLARINAGQVGDVRFVYEALVDNSWRFVGFQDCPPTPVSELDPSVLTYLHPSRYCQSDRLFRFAEHQFGNIENPFSQVVEVCDWINRNVEYLSGSTNGQTSAYDTVTQQEGVCRDFAHLGIALCRALTIPARYCAVYAYQLEPQDFHACFEAYLSGRWIVFDATRLAPLNGFVKIAMGRDAADTAVSNIFGSIEGMSMKVNSEFAGEEASFQPVFYDAGSMQAISYE